MPIFSPDLFQNSVDRYVLNGVNIMFIRHVLLLQRAFQIPF